MEKFGQYRYTKNVSEVHEKVKKIFGKDSGLNLDNVDFISAVWIENFLSKGSTFLIVTKDIIFTNSNGPFIQINIQTINSVQNLFMLEIVTNDGKKFKHFQTVILPKNLRPLIIGDINSAQTEPTEKANISSADELAKFKKLLDDGAITEEEYNKKKQQILGL